MSFSLNTFAMLMIRGRQYSNDKQTQCATPLNSGATHLCGHDRGVYDTDSNGSNSVRAIRKSISPYDPHLTLQFFNFIFAAQFAIITFK
jgi:hypothetical protein